MEKGGLAVWPVGGLGALRAGAGGRVARFCEIAGIPRATWYRRRSASSSARGPWPAPAQDAVEADAEAPAADWEGWGRRELSTEKVYGGGHGIR